MLAHVTVWTDQSVPALDFDVYLTGYDVQTISLRDIFVNGNLPITASAGQDPKDDISPKGDTSQDSNFAGCSGALPYAPGAVSPASGAHLQAWFQGRQSPATGNCAGSKTYDGIARGYVTVDTVNDCNLFFPSDFASYSAFLTNDNMLWGDVTYVIRIESSRIGSSPYRGVLELLQSGDHTFYGRYNGASAADMREPLPLAMGVRFTDSTDDLRVWRESNAAASGYSCNLQGPLSWYPLWSTALHCLRRARAGGDGRQCQGNPTCTQTILIPNEAQRVNVASDLLSPFTSGWAALDLRHSAVAPAYGDALPQMWVVYMRGDAGIPSLHIPNLPYHCYEEVGPPNCSPPHCG